MRFTRVEHERFDEVIFDDGGMNLLSLRALDELDSLVSSLSASEIVLFRSGQPRLFAAGADMAEMLTFDAWSAWEFSRRGQELFTAIEALPATTVCFIDGDCFGGALDLALAFDVRAATVRSRFAHPGARLGIVTGFGGTSRWKQGIGSGAARRLFLSNEILDATAAEEIGLIDSVAETADQVINRFVRTDRATRRFVKELSHLSPRLSRDELLLFARRLGHIYFPPRAEVWARTGAHGTTRNAS